MDPRGPSGDRNPPTSDHLRRLIRHDSEHAHVLPPPKRPALPAVGELAQALGPDDRRGRLEHDAEGSAREESGATWPLLAATTGAGEAKVIHALDDAVEGVTWL